MLDKRETRARDELISAFQAKYPEYVKLSDHPKKDLIKWAYEKHYSFPVVVGGVEFVFPGTLEKAEMWWEKEQSGELDPIKSQTIRNPRN